MYKKFFLLLWVFSPFFGYAQKERGRIIRAPKIFQKKKSTREPVEQKNFNNDFENEVDFIFEEEPRLRFADQFEKKERKIQAPNSGQGSENFSESVIRIEPLQELNETVSEDTSTIDEGELLIVEIEEEAQFMGTDQMSTIATYFDIWDTQSIDPYARDPKKYNDIIPIKLYDLSQGRYWSPPLDECPITSHFGWRWKRWHKGTDIDLVTGDPVYSVFDGIVRVAGTHGGWGRTVVIRHYNGLETLYGHLSKINFEPNTLVKAGDMIARGGNTGRSSGSHLHFETRFEGNAFDAENIFTFSRSKTEIKSQEFVMNAHLYDYLRGGSPRVVFDYEKEDGEERPTNITKKAFYKVKRGDNLTKIANKFGTSVNELCRLNKISARRKLYVGMKLRVK